MDRDAPTSPPEPGNLLLQTGDHGDCDESACMDLLGVADPADVDVLFVTFTKSARERLDALKRHADAPPANVGVVSVQVGGSNGGDRVGGSNGPAVRRISDPSDLTGVGIAISEFLSAWSGNDNRTVVCFESLTALLQYVDANRVFQFCNEITSKFDRAGAHAHFHITPEAHERQVLSVLSSLFDGRVDAADLGYRPAAADAVDEAADEALDGPVDEHADVDATSSMERVEPDDAAADPSTESDADPVEDDPFEYAVADVEDGSADEPEADPDPDPDPDPNPDPDPGTVTDEPTAEAGSTDDVSETDAEVSESDDDPADLVSSVIAGDDGDDPADPEDGDAGPSLDADVPDTGSSDDQPREDARPEATSRRTGNEDHRRRLEYIGPDASQPETTTGTEDDSESGGEDSSDGRFDRYTIYQRTTATVVGVVVMLVLISFLTAGMPLPLGTDAPGDGGADVTATPTPEAVAAADATSDATATATPEPTATPTPTSTPTPTPTPTQDSSTSSSSSSSSSSDDGSTGDSTPTETATPEPTETATPTPTPTESGDSLTDGISDTLDQDDDGTLL